MSGSGNPGVRLKMVRRLKGGYGEARLALLPELGPGCLPEGHLSLRGEGGPEYGNCIGVFLCRSIHRLKSVPIGRLVFSKKAGVHPLIKMKGEHMNFVHLKYAVEVEKTRSITKAADNLFMSQPNLSRAIKELEETLGITIFRRTSKGIVPTEQGEEFLSYAKNILAQVREMESIYKRDAKRVQELSVSVPRASYVTDAFTRFVSSLDRTKEIEIRFCETNSMNTVDHVLQDDYHLGVVRCRAEFEAYFSGLFREKELRHELVSDFEGVVLLSAANPLADKAVLSCADLVRCIEIAHGDSAVPTLPTAEVKRTELSKDVDKRIFVFERGSQFDLLENVPYTYLWATPLPEAVLRQHGLVQRPCPEAGRSYRDILIYRSGYKLSDLDMRFLKELQKNVVEISKNIKR